MNFELPGELTEIQQTVRRFVDEQLIPLERQLGDPGDIPDNIRATLNEKVRAMGFWGAGVPESLGGGGLGELGQFLIHEQVSRCVVGDVRDPRGFGGTPWPILCRPDQPRCRKYVHAVLDGTATDFFALTEPGAGNDINGITTRAVRDGTDWVLYGSKIFITGAGKAAFGTVVAVTGGQSHSSRCELTAFIVETGTEGLRISAPQHTLGAAKVFELSFDGCRVPDANRVGAVGEGRRLVAETLGQTRLRQGAYSLGLAQRALEMSIEHARDRRTFGRRLIERGAIQEMLATSFAELRIARLMLYTAAWNADHGHQDTLQVSRAKTFAAEMGNRVLDRAIQIHGGSGLTRDLLIERMYRDQRSLRITEGSSEIHRWIIARQILHKRETVPWD
jgi:acyl-CoA dehydrogenase